MASNTQNVSVVLVVRYSALLGGIAYGFMHNRTVQKEDHEASIVHANERRQHLIEEARKAYIAKKNAKPSSLITDPEDPKFDLEKVIASWEKA